ncbi:MAG TPA: hypothetical protein VGX23_02100 [Actinocrinis sp.]|nr:hypothetical protein [Actinocrinis sp.]
MTDQFDTAAIRSRVLESWVAAPVRFREDANLEEDLVLGGYRDRVLVELAQNAADAAARAGVPGRLRLTLRGAGAAEESGGVGDVPTLVAANTGSPLDAAGVVGLSTLRASSKRDEEYGDRPGDAAAVGRFGVGFAAVLAVSDEPTVVSRDGGVRFSASEARSAVRQAAAGSPELGVELGRRDGRVPILRLPYPASGTPPWGYDTEVTLPLRDGSAEELVRRLLGELDDTLLLALAQLAEIVVEVDGEVRTLTATRTAAGGGVGAGDECVVSDGKRTTRWRLAGVQGAVDRTLLADRPVEERVRARWSLTWAVAVDEDGGPQRSRAAAPVVYAPTPTDEPLGLPALLIASFPLDVTRRHVAQGPLTGFLLDQAAAAYVELVVAWPTRTPALLRLVPGPLAEGAIDAELRRRIADRLPEAAFLPAAHSPEPLRPKDAVALDPSDGELVAVVAEVLPGLLPAGWERDQAALTALRVRRMGAGELTEALAGLDREPAWWARLYAALNGVYGQDPGAREALATLPVPLADGRTVRGVRGTVLPVSELDPAVLAALGPLGLRIVNPAALVGGSGPASLLERLGAQPAQPRALLADPAVRGAVRESRDELAQMPGDAGGSGGPRQLAETVLALVRAAEPGPDERFDLGDLLLPDDQGGFGAARELLLPSSPLAEVVDPGAFGIVDEGWVQRWGADTLRAVGVLDTLALLRAEHLLLDVDALGDDEVPDLDGFEDWVDDLRAMIPRSAQGVPPVVTEFVAVRDLDLVTRWPRALELLAGPGLRAAVTNPVKVLAGDGQYIDLPSYTSWWLSRHPVLDGRCPADLATGGELLEGLYDQVPSDRDPRFLVGLGVRTTLDALLEAPGGPGELLDRLADPVREVSSMQLAALYRQLAEVPADRLVPPGTLRAWQDGVMVIAEAGEVLVIDAPDLLPLLRDRPYVTAPARYAVALADLLDLDLISETITGAVTSQGQVRPVPEVVLDLLSTAPTTYVEHDELVLDEGEEVTWRVLDGVAHASTFDGIARALAWAAGRWDRRHFVAAVLSEPERADELAAEADYE